MKIRGSLARGRPGFGRRFLLRTVAGAALIATSLSLVPPAQAQMAQALGIEDVNWRATLGTGVALETGGITRRDPFLLYFGAEVRKSWRWWYGLTFVTRGNLFTGLAEYPIVPYKLQASSSLGLGPHVFRMEVLRAELITEFGGLHRFNGLPDYSTGTNFRFEASTLPTFTGDVALGSREENIVSYFIVPVQLVMGHYNFANHSRLDFRGIDSKYNWRPYPAGKIRGQYRYIATEWFQLHGGLSFLKGYGTPDFRMQIDGGAAIGILENSVQFSLEFINDLWYAPICQTDCEGDPRGILVNTATFTLSARLRI